MNRRPSRFISSLALAIGSIVLAIGIFSTAVHAGVTDNIFGYAWSSNIGWVSFNPISTNGCPASTPASACNARIEWGTNGGSAVAVKGWARACSVFRSGCSGALQSQVKLGGWDGYIALGDTNTSDGANFGVTVNTTTNTMSGYAWGSDVVGWVDFSGIQISPDDCPVGSPCYCAANPGDTTNCPDDCPVGSACWCALPENAGDPQCPDDCPVGSPCYCVANPGDTTNCPDDCPVGSACYCAANPGDIRNCPPGGAGGMCSNIPDPVEVSLGITEASFPPYRKLPDGRCLCAAGYVLNSETYACVRPTYIEI